MNIKVGKCLTAYESVQKLEQDCDKIDRMNCTKAIVEGYTSIM